MPLGPRLPDAPVATADAALFAHLARELSGPLARLTAPLDAALAGGAGTLPPGAARAMRDDARRLEALADALHALRLGGDFPRADPARPDAFAELRRLARARHDARAAGAPSPVAVASADALFLNRVRDEVERKMERPAFRIGDVCEGVGVSHRHLRRRLHALTGLSPVDYVRFLRLERARKLLEQRAGNVSQVALRVGYLDADYFSRLFRQSYGVAPSAVEEVAGREGGG